MPLFMILSNLAISVHPSILPMPQDSFTRSIVIMKGAWENPEPVPPASCSQRSILVPILMLYATRQKIYTSMADERLMLACKLRLVLQSWEQKP